MIPKKVTNFESATLTAKGQVTLPKMIRETLGVESGDRVAFRVRANGVVELFPQTLNLMTLAGTVRPRRQDVTLKQMDQAALLKTELFEKPR